MIEQGIYASKGLFLLLELAWEGILDFAENEKSLSKIEEITPDGSSEDSNE